MGKTWLDPETEQYGIKYIITYEDLLWEFYGKWINDGGGYFDEYEIYVTFLAGTEFITKEVSEHLLSEETELEIVRLAEERKKKELQEMKGV